MHSTNQMLNYIHKAPLKKVSPEELSYMAYTGQYELVYSTLREIPENNWIDYFNKDVLNQAIWASIEKINKFKNIYNDDSIRIEKQFLILLLNEFIKYCEEEGNYSKELFDSLISAAEVFINLSEIDIANDYLQKTIAKGVSKYPLLKIDVYNKLALIYSKKGNVEKSLEYLDQLAKHPYLITNRNQIPEILFTLSQTLIKAGRIKSYSDILFMGLRHFYTNLDLRRKFVLQIRLTYGNSFRLLISDKLQVSNKLLYLIHWTYLKFPNFGKIKLSFINKISKQVLLGLIYFLNYVIKAKDFAYLTSVMAENIFENPDSLRIVNQSNPLTAPSKSKNILVTRAMGGIGDLLMMTPGFRELKKKYPKREIHLAIPKRYFPVFENNKDVKLVDIEEEIFSHFSYSKWFNLSDCPAARVESRTSPKVKKSRITLFAKGLGLGRLRLLQMIEKPKFIFAESEIYFADEFWKSFGLNGKTVIGVQIHSDERYRDYPHMEKLVKEISSIQTVIVFDSQKIKGYDFENVIKIDSLSLRNAFSLANKCDVIIGPDSSFIHFAAAFDKPTIALFGPIDGKVRTKHYANCVYIDLRDQLGCVPCWRNESIPCKLTGMRNSVCMESIHVSQVTNELSKMMERIKNENTK